MAKSQILSFLILLQKLTLGLLLLLLGTQLGKHFWPNFSLVNGLRVDYLSPTIYFTDILALIIISLNLTINFDLVKRAIKKISLVPIILIIGLLVILGIFYRSPLAYAYGLIKVGEWLGLFWAIKVIKIKPGWRFWLIMVSFFGFSFLALAQFFLQRSIGGGLYFLGERQFSSLTPGIAQAIWQGRLFLRPYATFSHPNSLAGFLLIGWWLMAANLKTQKKQKSERRSVAFLAITLLAATTLLLVWSRAVWLIILGEIILWAIGLPKRWYLWRSLIWGTVILGIIAPFFLDGLGRIWPQVAFKESVSLRSSLFTAGLHLFLDHPIVGVGLKNFIPWLVNFNLGLNRAWLQPVHSLYWLILVESGVLGFGLFLYLIRLTTKKLLDSKNGFYFFAWLSVLFLGVNDHYWLTLQQNQLLVVILLAWIWQIPRQIANSG